MTKPSRPIIKNEDYSCRSIRIQFKRRVWCTLSLDSLESAVTQWVCAKGFSPVAGGIKGCVMHESSIMRARNKSIAVCCITSQNRRWLSDNHVGCSWMMARQLTQQRRQASDAAEANWSTRLSASINKYSGQGRIESPLDPSTPTTFLHLPQNLPPQHTYAYNPRATNCHRETDTSNNSSGLDDHCLKNI